MARSRYLLIDTHTGRVLTLSADELQVLWWLAEREAQSIRTRTAQAVSEPRKLTSTSNLQPVYQEAP